MKRYKLKKLMPMVFALVSIMVLVFVIMSDDEEAVLIPNDINMDISVEIAQTDKIMEQFLDAAYEAETNEELCSAAEPYIPVNSWCTGVFVTDEVVYIDYQLDGVRYIVSYYKTGMIEKVARKLGEEDIYSVMYVLDSNTYTYDHINLQEN